MAGNPTAVNIGIGFNVQDIAPSRGQIASFMRDVKASITDVERFAQKVKIGESLLKKGDISQAEFDRTIAMHREKYGIIDQGEKRVAEYHAHKQAMAKREEDSMLFLMRLRQEGRKMDEEAHAKKMADVAAEKKAEEDSLVFLMNLNKTRIAMEQEKHAKQMADIAAEKKAEEDSIVFLMNLNKTRIAMEQEKHAKQMADIAAEKKAEEDSMIFLMELRKQQRIDEEQKHAKKLAAIAAEKQAEQTLGIGAYGSASAGPRASSMAVDVVTGKIIEQKKEVSSLEQLVGTLQASFASASTASTSNIDLVTGQLIKQKQEILTLEQAVLRYANASSKIRAEYAGIDLATGRVIQQKQEVLSLSDMGKVRSMLDQLTTAQQRYNQQLELIERMHRQERISLEQKSALLKKIKKDLDDANAAESKKSGLAGFLNRGVGGIAGGMLAGFGTAAIGGKVSDFLSSSVNIAVERQRVDMMLDALTSGTSSVGSLTGAIRELDKQSMLSYMEISKAAQTMLGFGVANELVMPSLNALSEISMGNAERFQSLSLAFGQVAASGKLAGQEILQMVNAGFNPLQEISRTTGRSMSDLRAAVSNGEISFSQVADAIISATEAGGRFYQMNETMMSTLGGRIAKFRSDLQIMQAELGQDLFPTIETILDMVTGSKDQTKEFFNSFVMFSDAVGFFISGVSDLLAWMTKGSGGGQKGAELMLKHVEKMKAAADSLEKAGDVEKAKTVREDAARIEQRISGGIREEMMQSEIDKFFQRLKDREQNRKEEEEKRKKEAEFQAELKRDPEKAKLWREELDNKMTLERLNKDTSKIAKEIEEERKNALMTEREILIENLGLANKVFDQDQRNLALKVLADFDASQIRKQREEDQNKLIKLLEDSKTAAEKLQEQINFVNEAQKNGLISAIDAKKILDKLNDDANKKDRDEQERRRKQLQEFSRSIDKRADAIERVKDIILAVKEGFLDQQTANKEAMEIARGLVSDADKVAMDNPRMMDLGQAKLASQKLAKQLQNEQKVIDKLTDLNALAAQLVQQNDNAPRLMKK